MKTLTSSMAVENLSMAGEFARFPSRNDVRCARGNRPLRKRLCLVPQIRPTFTFGPGERVFTIGSCFAREIEEQLTAYDLPTMQLAVPPDEWQWRPNGLLNEYNAGTIAQRIERAFTGEAAPAETVVRRESGGWTDLLLPTSPEVRHERAVERRRQIDQIYAQLPDANVVIVTLGLIESWYDSALDVFLNRKPPSEHLRDFPHRYKVTIFDVDDAFNLLEPAFRRLSDRGTKTLLTVSPVPFVATFSGEDVIVANMLSKSVLRVCAQRLAETVPGVDYFPSYEIVSSGGLHSYLDDNIHVDSSVVEMVTTLMLDHYERR